MTTSRHIPEDDLALFALALMQPEEAAITAAHLKHCDACRAEVARLQGDLVVYAMTAEMHDAPAASRERLIQGVAKERKYMPQPVAPVAESVLPARHIDLFQTQAAFDQPKGRTGLFGWAGWALAAALAAVVGWQFFQGQDLKRTIAVEGVALEHSADALPGNEVSRAREVLQTLMDPNAMQVALHLPAPHQTQRPEGHAAYVASTGNLIFVGTHLRPVPGNRTYELWLLPASGEAPVPAGLFRPDPNGNASVVLPTLPKNIAAKGFGVTVEPDGGSSKPTPPILLAGS